MPDAYLVVSSQYATISSNEIATTGVGVEVLPSLAGMGLPGIELQFDQNAGDGARYRGARVQQRTLDVAFHAANESIDELRATLDRISLSLLGKVTATWFDNNGDAWVVSGYRSGGGDYSYGDADDPNDSGTDGQRWATLVVSLITESPFWRTETVTTATRTNSGTLTALNAGTASTAPVFTVTGPTNGFTLTNGTRSLGYTGIVRPGEQVVVDCAAGTVKDNQGRNRYNYLKPLPSFFSLPPGEVAIQTTFDSSSADYSAGMSSRTNHSTNPALTTNAAGWTVNAGFTYNNAQGRLNATAAESVELNGRPYTSHTVSGLTIGTTYFVSIGFETTAPQGNYPNGTLAPGKGVIRSGDTVKSFGYLGSSPMTYQFVAAATTMTLEVYLAAVQTANNKWRSGTGSLTSLYVGENGTYFDGDTPDTSTYTYSWASTANASKSTAVPVTIPSGGAQVTVAFNARKQLMI